MLVTIIVLIVAGGWYLVSFNQKSETRGPIRIGIDVFPGWGHAFIAQDQGFFTDNGVEVELVLNEDYLTIQGMYQREEIDAAFMVFADAIYTYANGMEGQVVYISDRSITGDVIVARENIKSIQDLKGQIIGVEGINTFSHLFVLSVLEMNGLNESDVHIKYVGAQEVVAALSRGEIAAGHTYGPDKYKSQQAGYSFLAYARDVPGIITDTLVFNNKVIDEKPDDVAAVVSALFRAKSYQTLNREQAIGIIARNINDSPESVRIGLDAVEPFDAAANLEAMLVSNNNSGIVNTGQRGHLFKSYKLITDFYLTRGEILNVPEYDLLVEPRFVREFLNK